jgi:hypothetical protein
LKPFYNEEAVKLRNTLFNGTREIDGSKMVAEEVKPAKKAPSL